MAKQILLNPDVLPKLLKGAQVVRKSVAATMGPNGRNCVYERFGDNVVLSTRDGVTVARQIELEDVFENMGAQMVRGVANEQVVECGDGTTLSTVLTESIFAEGVKAITVGANPVAIKRGIEKAVIAIVAELQKYKVDVEDDMLLYVATISANNDKFLGNLISTAMIKAGKDGVVVCEESRTPESSLEIMEGVQFASGYMAPEFVTNEERKECVLEDVYILLHEKPLRHLQPMMPVLKQIVEQGKSFLVIAEDVVDEAFSSLRINAKPPEGAIPRKFCSVKSPGGLEHLKDLAALTGAKVLTESLGIKLSDVQLSYLGHAKKIIIRQNNTTIISDEKENPALTQRIQELRTQVTSTTDNFERDRLQGRLARLSGGVAIIKIGANTLLEMQEKKDRLEDSLHATRCAELEGVVPGGGVALARASSNINIILEGDESIGAKIVQKACLEPIKTIANNSGENGDLICRETLKQKNPNFGYNARSGEYGNLVSMGVLDPFKVIRTALQTSASVASLMLISEVLVSSVPFSKGLNP